MAVKASSKSVALPTSTPISVMAADAAACFISASVAMVEALSGLAR